MSVIRVTKEFGFEMAHVLNNYDGPCRNVHGHSYRLFVTVAGSPVSDPGSPKLGMVIDFGDMKKIVRREIVDLFDHSVVVSTLEPEDRIASFRSLFGNTVVVDYQPTCENLVADFAARIVEHLPAGVILHSLRLFETATSYAEWHAGDNR
ncbi:MAG: 6-carboxytetrahydropterin synthase [Bacteroidales bacterium]|jgi:6-pyruvoyltetrahydropterin/6-carboxytetrahydropterin synthase|nr:6-carboxytetrahydropterin synthase [Bacteroidales bacterium]